MTVVDCVASHGHYFDHLYPVFSRLPDSVKGDIYLGRRFASEFDESVRPISKLKRSPDRFLLAASFGDLRYSKGRKPILMEHGCGQSYKPATCSYAGGPQREHVVAFLCPNYYSARLNETRYPKAKTFVVGSPRLALLQSIPPAPMGDRIVVAVSFHFDLNLYRETRSGWGFFLPGVRRLAADPRFEVLGHAHPKLFDTVAPTYRRMGVEPVPTFEEVLGRAHVYACDNSSTLFEWSFLRGPTVVMNAPWYRRNVHHGLRFWDASDIGPHVDDPDTLPLAVDYAFTKGENWPGREESLDKVFAPVEDPASCAVDAIVETVKNNV